MRKAMFALASAAALAASAENILPNGGFEELGGDGWAKGWMHYGKSAWKIDAETKRSGKYSFMADITDTSVAAYGRCSGVRRYIDFKEYTNDPVYFGVWSKAEGVYCGRDYECCISVGYDDDTWDWSLAGNSVKPLPGTHGWQLSQSVVFPKKPVKKIVFYAFIRKGVGKAWFDDMFLERRDPGPVWLGCKRMTDRPFSDSGKLVVTIPEKTLSWESEAGGMKGAGKDKGAIEVPVPDSACEVKLTLSDGAATNSYTIAIGPSELKEPYLEPNDVCVWTADSMRRVTPLTWPTGDELVRPAVKVDMAAGGAASAQILVSAGSNSPRKSVNVEIGELRAADGGAFRGSVKWERVAYVERQYNSVPHPQGPHPEERWLPDPLLPAAPFRLRAGSTQSAWLTFTAARDAKPGVYSAKAVVVTSAAEERFEIPVSVTVRPFALPETFGMETAVSVVDPFTRRFFPKDAERMIRASKEMMLDHRLNADDISRWTPQSVEYLHHAVSRGANRFNALALLYPPKNPNAMFAPWPSPEEVAKPEYMEYLEKTLDPIAETLRKEGLIKYAYLYGFDERNQEHYAGIDAIWRKLHERYPDLPVMTTARMYKDMVVSGEGTNFPHAVTTDWYCPVTSVWDRRLSEQLQALGKKVWWYTCCGPLYPFANFASVEAPWFEARVLAWQQYMEKADGFLFWAVNWWPLMKRLDPGDTYQKGRTLWSDIFVQGDGVLVYPGPDAIYPSTRLAAMRDGVQDYEWLLMAEAASSRAESEKACASFIRSLEDFDRDGRSVEKARAMLGRILEKK